MMSSLISLTFLLLTPLAIIAAPLLNPCSFVTSLRIMPLGASITYGIKSTDDNGYRGDLYTQLNASGCSVTMVGSRAYGTMVQNHNEGWPGFTIDQVAGKANASVPVYRPNLVLVNAGTNDCVQDVDIGAAGARMRHLIEAVQHLSPRATVVLSSLLVNASNGTEANVLRVNLQFRALAAQLRAEGKRVVFANMHGPDGPALGDLVDGTHPDDAGYAKMADIWYRSVVRAAKEDFLLGPERADYPAE